MVQAPAVIDATLSSATTGLPRFSPFDPETGGIAKQQRLGGCQPYFSHDGRWGFWTAGAGGPVNRIDLETRAVTTLIEKGDARLPRDLGYVYFPMVSRDGRLFAFAASNGSSTLPPDARTSKGKSAQA